MIEPVLKDYYQCVYYTQEDLNMTRDEILLLSKYINVHLYRLKQDINPDITSSLTAESVLSLLKSGYVDKKFEWTNKLTASSGTILYQTAKSSVCFNLRYWMSQKRSALSIADVPLKDLPFIQPELPLDLQIDLKRFLERLGKDHRNILKMHQEGYTIREIASMIESSTNYVLKKLNEVKIASSEYFGYKKHDQIESTQERQRELNRIRCQR